MRGCVRVECEAAADAALVLDNNHSQVFIVDVGEVDELLTIGLCHHHADEVSMPVGWTITDRRTAQQALFEVCPALVTEPTASVERLDHRRARRETSFEEPTLFSSGELADQTGMAPEAQPISPADESTDEAPWIGKPERRHSELLEVDDGSPLLARAFRASRAS